MRSFYAGLDSALLRQAVYASARIGLYHTFSDIFRKKNDGGDLSFLQKCTCSLASGALGSGLATPCDLVLVRMQSDKRPDIALKDRRNYTSVFNAFRRIVAEEGAKSLYTGGQITMMRAMAMNTFQLVTFEQTKEALRATMPESSNRKISIMGSLVAAVACAVGVLPFDNIKTKLQNQKTNADGSKQYKGIADAVAKTIAKEGPTGLWAGLPTFYVRVGPHAVITLLVNEQLRNIFLKK